MKKKERKKERDKLVTKICSNERCKWQNVIELTNYRNTLLQLIGNNAIWEPSSVGYQTTVMLLIIISSKLVEKKENKHKP